MMGLGALFLCLCTSISFRSLGLYLCGGIGKSWTNLLGKREYSLSFFFFFF